MILGDYHSELPSPILLDCIRNYPLILSDNNSYTCLHVLYSENLDIRYIYSSILNTGL